MNKELKLLEGELEESSTISKMEIVEKEGFRYEGKAIRKIEYIEVR